MRAVSFVVRGPDDLAVGKELSCCRLNFQLMRGARFNDHPDRPAFRPLASWVLGLECACRQRLQTHACRGRASTAAVCSSCHDKAEVRSHMVRRGGASFATTQAAIGTKVVERCANCHGPGKSKDVRRVHQLSGSDR
jgi:cytochrome c553